MSQRGRGKEDLGREPVVRAQSDSETVLPNGTQIPERHQYTSDDPLHGKITTLIGEKVNYLYQKAVENPNSEANEIVRILLLNQIRHMEPETYQQEPKMTITEERRRSVDVKDKEEVNRRKGEQFELARAKHKAEMRKLNAQIKGLEADVQQKKIKLQQAQRVVDQARAAEEHGQPMDPQQVYEKIFEIVGLNAPLEPIGDGAGQ